MVFFIMVVVIATFFVLWNFDLHRILHVKSVSQNAGDAAALMAARWQGITLNLIGDLNLLQAVALSSGDTDTAASITNMQARLCFVGPMIGFMAAQQAAKGNKIYVNPEYTRILREHADRVRSDYPSAQTAGGEPLFPEPYPGCWREYAAMLDVIADEGVAAGPDNIRYYTDRAGGHVLLDIGFYEAVGGRNWCWFHHHAPDLPADYTNYRWWSPLPDIPHFAAINSEIYGLGLSREFTGLDALTTDFEAFADLAEERSYDRPADTSLTVTATWYVYDAECWTAWDAISPYGEEPFPVTGPVRPQYDYAGADAAVRIEAEAARITPGPGGASITNIITWSAAAKPLGYLNDDDRPDSAGLVLPAYHDVRLIPIDASSAPAAGGYNLAWRRHIEDHLPAYMQYGPRARSCWYCLQLRTWEDPLFRGDGVAWLEENSWRCDVSASGGGGHRGGGTRRGH